MTDEQSKEYHSINIVNDCILGEIASNMVKIILLLMV